MTRALDFTGPYPAAPELLLTSVTNDLRAVFQRSRTAFASFVGMRLPAGWPEFPEAFVQRPGPDDAAPWTGYLFSVEDQLVGNGGFVAPPDPSGTVEIGFEIAPAFRNRGYATAAGRRLIRIAFEHGALRVIAHTLADRSPSSSALRKAGMAPIGPIKDPSFGQICRFGVTWPGLA